MDIRACVCGLYLPFISFVVGRLALSITGDNLDLVDLHELGDLSELNVVQNERPHVVAEPVRVQRSLRGRDRGGLDDFYFFLEG